MRTSTLTPEERKQHQHAYMLVWQKKKYHTDKEWRRKHIEQSTRWNKEHPEKRREIQRRRLERLKEDPEAYAAYREKQRAAARRWREEHKK